MLLGACADGAVVFFIPILLAEFTKTDLAFAAFAELVPMLVGCFIASLALQWFLRRDGEALAKEFGNYLRLKYFKIIARLDIATLGKYHSGYLLSLVTKICEQSSQVLFSFAWLVAHSFATLTLFFAYTARESVVVAVLNLVVLLIFLFVSILLSRQIVPFFGRLNLAHASLVERYVDLVSNISTVKRLGLFKFAEEQISEQIEANVSSIRALQRTHANRWILLHSIYGVAFLATISFLLYQITSGVASASILILFISAYGVIRSQVERLSELVADLLGLNAYTAALQAIVESSKIWSGAEGIGSWQRVELSEVLFAYREQQRGIEISSFCLQKGNRVCITGESGVGKSTLLNILGGFLEVKSGRRLLDGRPFEEFSAEALASHFALVSQEAELFNLSVRLNLSLGRETSDEKILAMLQGLKLMEWFEQLPDGLDTTVGEKGLKLSAGQRQRLNIARGLLLDRQIMLFDEPTSHLDQDTEAQVVEFLRQQLEGKTAVFVTHRPAIRALCGAHYDFDGVKLQPL